MSARYNPRAFIPTHVESLHHFITISLISEHWYNILSLMWLMGVSDYQLLRINEITNQTFN